MRFSPLPLDAHLAAWPFQLNQALSETNGLWRHQFQKRCRRHRRPRRRRAGFHHALELAVLQSQGLGRAENPVLPSRFRRCCPQRLWDRQAGLVPFSPTLETPADLPQADWNLKRFFGGHGRSSSPLPGERRRYQLRAAPVMQACRKLTRQARNRAIVSIATTCRGEPLFYRSLMAARG